MAASSIGFTQSSPRAKAINSSALADPERYQTVYAALPGSVAAPTAGLHFTPALLDACVAAGADVVMPMVKDIKHVPALRKALPGTPMVWLQYFGGPTLNEVKDAGADLVIFPQACMLLAMNAIKQGFSEVLQKGRLESYDTEWMNKGIKTELLSLIGLDAYYALEARTTEGREAK